jgi:hypothetical protein
MRPLIEMPKWDGKLVLGAFFTAGYFAVAAWIIRFAGLNPQQKELAMIVLAALGPQLGQIYGAIFRTTGAEERNSARQAETLKTAIETPTTVVQPAPTNEQPDEDPEILK